MTLRRKAFLLEPGEQLLLSDSAITVAGRFDDFATASGLAPDDILGSPLCATPIPVYEKDEHGVVKRLSSANPGFMWHPLMWLPENSALRYQLRVSEDSDELRLESDHEWAVRIGLEMHASGLYDTETGTWLDVLAVHGIDIDNPVDHARVESWLSGGADADLDAVDLSDLIQPNRDDDWSLVAAQELARVLIPAQWSMTAESLLDAINTSMPPLSDPSDRVRLTRAVANLTLDMLSDVPEEPGADTTEDMILDIVDMLADDATADVEAALESLTTLLTSVRDDYAIARETLEAGERGAA